MAAPLELPRHLQRCELVGLRRLRSGSPAIRSGVAWASVGAQSLRSWSRCCLEHYQVSERMAGDSDDDEGDSGQFLRRPGWSLRPGFPELSSDFLKRFEWRMTRCGQWAHRESTMVLEARAAGYALERAACMRLGHSQRRPHCVDNLGAALALGRCRAGSASPTGVLGLLVPPSAGLVMLDPVFELGILVWRHRAGRMARRTRTLVAPPKRARVLGSTGLTPLEVRSVSEKAWAEYEGKVDETLTHFGQYRLAWGTSEALGACIGGYMDRQFFRGEEANVGGKLVAAVFAIMLE